MVVLGGALPGLVAAVRLGQQRARVLVLEEAEASRLPDALRDPFWLGSAERESILGSCLRELRVPLIDQRRVERDAVPLQVLTSTARVDFGEPDLCADEWTAWGLAKPDGARSLAAELARAAAAERAALCGAPFARAGRRLAPGPRREGSPGPRGLPAAALEAAPAELGALFGCLEQGLAEHAGGAAHESERAWLLGAPLLEGASVRAGDATLRAILRRRIESLYGEFRSLPASFRLVVSSGQPGVAPDARGESDELWVGRALVLNAPREALAAAHATAPVPDLLAPVAPARARWQAQLFSAPRALVPEALASRALLPAEPERGRGVLRLRCLPGRAAGERMRIHAATRTAPDAPLPADDLRERLATLLPFAAERLEALALPQPRWDHDSLLLPAGCCPTWPAEIDLRVSSRPPVYALERAAVAGLGSDGELLLGWRGGDAIAQDLT